MTQTQAYDTLQANGFDMTGLSSSGAWATFKDALGNKVSIEMATGRVVRTNKIDMGPSAPNPTLRWNPNGTSYSLNQDHSTISDEVIGNCP
jgi:hypothetical protein